ncbi:hypothetical protein LCGC14_1050840 [marine sediment metagenome]|uniref:Uncharacterized protein n=1 Tax=marine sediment metagenome TaxID=412755 RepID=A0A0F9NAQ0_9ZZZZ
MISNIIVDSILSFLGGLLAFFGPCAWLILLGFFSIVTGATLAGELGKKKKSPIRMAILLFVAGLSITFVANFFPSSLQLFLSKHYNTATKISGALIFFFGFFFLEISNAKLTFKDENSPFTNFRISASYLLLGVAFGMAWTHCLTPVLSMVIGPIVKNPALSYRGLLSLWMYALGLSVPLLTSALVIKTILNKYKVFKNYSREIKMFNGLILASLGVAVFIKPWWIFLSEILINWTHTGWKNQLEYFLIELLKKSV